MSIWKKLYLAWENKNCEEFNLAHYDQGIIDEENK